MELVGKYFIPKKRTICVICYNKQVFRSDKELITYLKDTLDMSELMITHLMSRRLPKKTKEEMDSILYRLGYNDDNRTRLLVGLKAKKQ